MKKKKCCSVQCVEEFGNDYYEKYIKNQNPKEMKQDWWVALTFWFDRAFYRGRRDKLSKVMETRAFEALDKILGKTNSEREAELNRLATGGWLKEGRRKKDDNPLQKALKKAEVKNRYDRLLVISTLEFLQTLPNMNIIEWTIERRDFEFVYRRLNKLFAVGDKTASFYLRDVVDIFELQKDVEKQKSEIYVQPVDTWVRQVAIELELVSEDAKDKDIKGAIVDTCRKCGVEPIRFNQGAWYIGSNSFKIVIKNLSNL